MCRKVRGNRYNDKPDGGCIKHTENSQTIDKRIQFGRNSPVRVRVRMLGALYLALPPSERAPVSSVLGDTLEAQQTSQGGQRL